MVWRHGHPVVAPYKPIPRNIIIYDGPSRLDRRERILAIVSASNQNRKIWNMLQVWIMLRDVSPIKAVKRGRDAAICGTCIMRGDGRGNNRACYVNYWREVENIWQARRKAARMLPAEFAAVARGLQIRIAAYGNPTAVPMRVWRPMLETAGGWTAYTSDWHRWVNREYASFCMASVKNEAEQAAAVAKGWRTFRVRQPGEPVLENEIVCPYEQGRAKCDKCELCQGGRRAARNIVIEVHGLGKPGAFDDARELIQIRGLRSQGVGWRSGGGTTGVMQ